MSSLSELIERVEKLKGRDSEMDSRIWCAVFAPPDAYVERSTFNGAWCIYRQPLEPGKIRLWQASNSHVKPVTSSIDAALTLLPISVKLDLILRDDGTGYACAWTKNGNRSTSHRSLVLALAATCLKARLALDSAQDRGAS